MIEWLFSIVAWLVPDADVEAFRRTAPSYLSSTVAREHLSAARIAGKIYRVDPDVLLAIAWRESRYKIAAVTRERSGKLSCGQMMITMPLGEPCPTPSVIGGYLGGAAHLRAWIKLTRGDEHNALLGYAGGYTMIRACADGPVLRIRAGREVDLCTTPEVARASWIRHARRSTRGQVIW